MMPRKYYEVTDGDDHVGYVSEEYTMKKFDEKILTGKAECNFLIGKYETIDVEPVKHGRWIFGETMGHSWMKCSECCVSQSGQTATFTYCPNCGAKMDKVKND